MRKQVIDSSSGGSVDANGFGIPGLFSHVDTAQSFKTTSQLPLGVLFREPEYGNDDGVFRELSVEEDGRWIEALAFPGTKADRDIIGEVNEIVDTGSIPLTIGVNDPEYESVVAARKKFFEGILGLNREDHPLHKSALSKNGSLVRSTPLDTFISCAREMSCRGMDVRRIYRIAPGLFAWNSESLAQNLHRFDYLGVNSVKIIDRSPTIAVLPLDLIEERLRAVDDFLVDLGLQTTAEEFVEHYPAILTSSTLKIDAVRALMMNHADTRDIKDDPAAIQQWFIPPLSVHVLAIATGRYTANELAHIGRDTRENGWSKHRDGMALIVLAGVRPDDTNEEDSEFEETMHHSELLEQLVGVIRERRDRSKNGHDIQPIELRRIAGEGLRRYLEYKDGDAPFGMGRLQAVLSI